MTIVRLLRIVVVVAVVSVANAAEPAPPLRVGSTWQESMLATRDAFRAWAKQQSIELPERMPNQPPAYFHALWRQLRERFPCDTAWIERDVEELPRFFEWFLRPDKVEIERRVCFRAADDIARFGTPWANAKKDQWRREADRLLREKVPSSDRHWLDLYVRVCAYRDVLDAVSAANVKSLRAAVDDLAADFPARYRADGYRRQLDELERQLAPVLAALEKGSEDLRAESIRPLVDRFLAMQHDALIANPLLDFDQLLLIKRKDPDKSRKYFTDLGLPSNWQGNCALKRDGWDNEIAVLAPVNAKGKLTTRYRPEADQCLADIDLHWDAQQMLFSMQKPGDRRWQVWELAPDGRALRQVTPDLPEADNYDACYLPSGDIIFASTAVHQGVPCVAGGNRVANLFRLGPDGKSLRQLCFDQDHNWCPTVMHNGRVLYTRWEYADTPHYFPRLLMRMNPDGTGQAEHYGSNSYWPNSLFFARPIPGHSTKLVTIYSGHHGNPRMGGLVILDPARGRHEADGVVQTIPQSRGPFVPKIGDGIVDDLWLKFLHPYPLSDKYFLVSCKPAPNRPWGVYLVDVFDNMLLLCEQPGYALFEPIPLRRQPHPPVVPDRIDPKSKTATVYLADVYAGNGLKGVPRGTIKGLRVYEYHYTYPGAGGHIHIGIDGPWDVHRILGTTDMQEDGSAAFEIPANTPVAVQTLDEQGQAVQLMRSWFVGMPGETVSCVGCHESQNTGPPPRGNMAMRRGAAPLKPWYGPPRGFSFAREVQPVLDKYCVGCHDGRPAGGGIALNLRGDQPLVNACGNDFDAAYMALHRYVRRPGNESDYRLLNPYDYHVSTSWLVQMLAKGHYGVQLDREAWDRLTTWIDLNVPDHGTWGEHRAIRAPFRTLRQEACAAYANRSEDPEEIINPYRPGSVAFVAPAKTRAAPKSPIVTNWPFDAAEAKRPRGCRRKARLTWARANAWHWCLYRPASSSWEMWTACPTKRRLPPSRLPNRSIWASSRLPTRSMPPSIRTIAAA